MAYSAVGVDGRGHEGSGHVVRSEAGAAFESLGHADEEVGEYDAAVAPAAHERFPRHDAGGVGDGIGHLGAGFGNYVSQGEVHIGSGVAVRNGEDVQPVQFGDVGFDELKGGVEHGEQARAIVSQLVGRGGSRGSHSRVCPVFRACAKV